LLDWKVYREMVRLADDPMWGMYPHPPIGTIATSLGIARNSVWARFQSWQRTGFARGYEVFPNPRLLGLGIEAFRVEVPNPEDRRNFVDELEFVDGVLISQSEVSSFVVVDAIADSPESRARREKILRRIEGVASIKFRRSCWLPLCPARISSSDWQLIAAVRRQPSASMEALSQGLDRSAKTVARDYKRLCTSRAMLSYRVDDFRRFPGTAAGLEIRTEVGIDAREVAGAVQRLFPDALELPVADQPYQHPAAYLAFELCLPAAAGVEQVVSEASALKGVARVLVHFIGWDRAYRHWFDTRLYEITQGKGLALANGSGIA
jgi:DNA-binding Lrp family transcriptional regulator